MSTDTAQEKVSALHKCGCLTGTGQECQAATRKSFAQGHDARMSSRVAQAIADEKMTEDDGLALVRNAGGGDLLVSKTKHSAALRKSKKSDKAARPAKSPSKKAEQEAAEIAAARGEGGPQIKGKKVKVWHGKRRFDAIVVANAKEELVARHRFVGKNCDHKVEVDGEDILTGQAL